MSYYREKFAKRAPNLAQQPGLLADEVTIKKQPCSNWRCRGNIDYCCVYNVQQHQICGDKDSVNDPFFLYD